MFISVPSRISRPDTSIKRDSSPPSTEGRDLFIRHIFTRVAPYLDVLSSGFSFGMDKWWRRRAAKLSGIKQGDRVLDICSGTGELAFALLPMVGHEGSIVGTDFCENMVEIAQRKSASRKGNITFSFADAKDLPFSDSTFDAVTVGFGMRNIPDTILALEEIRRVLKPGGRFLCLELTRPRDGWFLKFYLWYLNRFMPFISNLVLKSATPYLYLPRSIEAFYQPPEFREVIARNGFEDVAVDSLTMGAATVYRATRHE